jgi:hypothetical protein
VEPIKAVLVMRDTLRYIQASLIYMVAGLALYILSLNGVIIFNQDAFFLTQLYGFVAMMIFGISYLFIPAFSHKHLYSLKLIRAQFILANAGVLSMATLFSGVLRLNSPSPILISIPLTLELVAVCTHAFNLWMTMQGYGVVPGAKIARQSK